MAGTVISSAMASTACSWVETSRDRAIRINTSNLNNREKVQQICQLWFNNPLSRLDKYLGTAIKLLTWETPIKLVLGLNHTYHNEGNLISMFCL